MAKLIKKEEGNIVWSDCGDKTAKKTSDQIDEVRPAEICLKIEIQKNKRGGKIVSVIKDLPHNPEYFKKLLKKMKSALGTGGSFKDDSLEIQGDHRDKMSEFLHKQGFKVKLSGG